MKIITEPWPWYIAGPMIGLLVPALYLAGNKAFGVSSSLRHACAICIPGNSGFFKYDWKKEIWNLFFVFGIVIGGLITISVTHNEPVEISESLAKDLSLYGITDFNGLIPSQLFSWSNLLTLKGIIIMVLGGFLVGFGSRYAGGCTSGHSISGISNLQIPSVIATCCFMVGGYIMTNLFLPYILSL